MYLSKYLLTLIDCSGKSLSSNNCSPKRHRSHSMAQFKEESLIPLINVTRKLLSCDMEQQLNALPKLARILSSHGASISLAEIIVTGLCQHSIYDRISKEIFAEIQSVLPSDKQLNLKDSMYESRLVDEQEDHHENGKSIKKKEKLPVTLLRIPGDLQCHIFQYLKLSDLQSVQKVCRALCFEARNPNALHSLTINPLCSKIAQFIDECYSRPTVLSLESWFPTNELRRQNSVRPLIGNVKWGEQVVDLNIEECEGNIDLCNLVPFRNLEKCNIQHISSALSNGLIASYHTLTKLSLKSITLTEDIMEQIQKFQNLEDLSFGFIELDRNQQCQPSDPISLPKLKTLSWRSFSWETQDDDFRNLYRILSGSYPATVYILPCDFVYNRDYRISDAADVGLPILTMPLIGRFTYDCTKLLHLRRLNTWLNTVKSTRSKLFDVVDLHISIFSNLITMDLMLSPLIAILQYAKESVVTFECCLQTVSSCDVGNVIQKILEAPSGTFTELNFKIGFDLFKVFQRDGPYDSDQYIESLCKCLDDEENVERD